MQEQTMDYLSELAKGMAEISANPDEIAAEIVVGVTDTIEVALAIVGPDIIGTVLDAVLDEIDNDSHEHYHEMNDYYRSMHELHSIR